MPLDQKEWEEIFYVIGGALANLDVKIRALEATHPSLPKENLKTIQEEIRKELFQKLHRQFTRTLLASHNQKTHQEMDLEWMEKEMKESDDSTDPPSSP